MIVPVGAVLMVYFVLLYYEYKYQFALLMVSVVVIIYSGTVVLMY